jgi:hypothetical protein
MKHETPAMRIGKHEWRAVVLSSEYSSGNTIAYQFRRIGETDWQPSDRWPSYDINDGQWGGMPRGLKRLYQRHEADLLASLNGQRSGLLALS